MTLPDGFVWAAAYPIEGAHDEDGKGPSLWDVFCRQGGRVPMYIGTGAVAAEHYHRYRQNVALHEPRPETRGQALRLAGGRWESAAEAARKLRPSRHTIRTSRSSTAT